MFGHHIEALENRRLFSASSSMTTMLPSLVNAASSGTVRAAGATVHYTKLKGTYSGSYTRDGHTYTFTAKVSQFTHTGHFNGTITIGGTPIGSVNATFTGRIRTNRHFTINFSGTGFSGTLVGQASHTGGHLKGTYTISGLVNASGPFDVGK
jgi:hypothetical protein